jgi:hypothetical protein
MFGTVDPKDIFGFGSNVFSDSDKNYKTTLLSNGYVQYSGTCMA